jgi:uncharacterized membrane protein
MIFLRRAALWTMKGGEQVKLESNRIVLGLFVEAIALCLIMAFRFINIQATLTLLVFNMLFLSLTIHLNGTRNKKMAILTLGNIIGLFWSFVLNQFAIACNTFFGEPFSIFYAVVYPFLNFMWIVSYPHLFGRIHIISFSEARTAWVSGSNGK